MKNDFLQKIVEYKRQVVADKRELFARYKKEAAKSPFLTAGLFRHRVAKMGRVNAILEIKKASPSLGVIREDFNVENIAKIYFENGAAAFSILTEDKFFQGKPEYIKTLSRVYTDTPMLAKDFFIDEGQIYEARANGALAVLLIVRLLTDDQIKHFTDVIYGLGMDPLVEVHDQQELDRAMKLKADIIGVNNRNLDTFVVDMKTSDVLIPQIVKAAKVAVVESGIKTHEDILHIKSLGAHAVLIGETFMRAPDIGRKIKEVIKGITD